MMLTCWHPRECLLLHILCPHRHRTPHTQPGVRPSAAMSNSYSDDDDDLPMGDVSEDGSSGSGAGTSDYGDGSDDDAPKPVAGAGGADEGADDDDAVEEEEGDDGGDSDEDADEGDEEAAAAAKPAAAASKQQPGGGGVGAPPNGRLLSKDDAIAVVEVSPDQPVTRERLDACAAAATRHGSKEQRLAPCLHTTAAARRPCPPLRAQGMMEVLRAMLGSLLHPDMVDRAIAETRSSPAVLAMIDAIQPDPSSRGGGKGGKGKGGKGKGGGGDAKAPKGPKGIYSNYLVRRLACANWGPSPCCGVGDWQGGTWPHRRCKLSVATLCHSLTTVYIPALACSRLCSLASPTSRHQTRATSPTSRR